MDLHWPTHHDPFRRPEDTRERMIRETNAFLSWSLMRDRGLPRIPRRRVDLGGFGTILRHPGAKALVNRWWAKVLSDHRME